MSQSPLRGRRAVTTGDVSCGAEGAAGSSGSRGPVQPQLGARARGGCIPPVTERTSSGTGGAPAPGTTDPDSREPRIGTLGTVATPPWVRQGASVQVFPTAPSPARGPGVAEASLVRGHVSENRHRADQPARRRVLDLARPWCQTAAGCGRRHPAPDRRIRRRRLARGGGVRDGRHRRHSRAAPEGEP